MAYYKMAGHCVLVVVLMSVTLSMTQAQTTPLTSAVPNDTSTLTVSSTMSSSTLSIPAGPTTPQSRGGAASTTGSVLLVTGCLAVFLRSLLLSR